MLTRLYRRVKAPERRPAMQDVRPENSDQIAVRVVKSPPRVREWPFLGSAIDLARDPLRFLDRVSAEYGDAMRFPRRGDDVARRRSRDHGVDPGLRAAPPCGPPGVRGEARVRDRSGPGRSPRDGRGPAEAPVRGCRHPRVHAPLSCRVGDRARGDNAVRDRRVSDPGGHAALGGPVGGASRRALVPGAAGIQARAMGERFCEDTPEARTSTRTST